GKTAVVEGLALKIVQGDVPDNLKGVELYGLDMGLLQAGASVKGEFEKRLNAVLDEVKNSPTPIILFIDEAHTLVGGGNQAGGSDAANLLKPALARGEVKTIAATTWSEYKKYFEKDPALARRFQLVKLDEPSPEQAALIIRGLRPAYEKSHNVYVRDDAITAAAALSARYISGRQLPDKAIDVLDTACARVNISLNAIPASVETLQQELAAQQRELEALERDALQQTGDKHSLANIPDLKLAMEATKEELAEQEVQWHKEKEQIQEMIALRSRLHELVFGKVNEEELVVDEDSEQDVSPYTEMDEEAVRIAISACQEQLDAIRNGNPLVHFEVGPDEVSHVISDWTGIPMGKMLQDEAETTLKLKESLTQSIKGQEYAIDALSEGIQTAKAGLGNPDAPTGVFLLVGPSGVGKTETARAIADQMFGGERFMTTINMSEFQEKHTVSRLIGSPPGYVGYGEGGMLTEAVRQRPYSVVLLDEVEKADPEVLNLFYQVFDKGTLNDGEGRTIDFKNTLIIMTSNLATHEIESLVHQSKDIDANIIAEAIRPTLNQHFKPALLARMSVLPFVPLSDEAMTEIIHHKLNKVSQRLHSHHKLSLNYEESLVDFVLGNCRLAETGARNIDAVINRQLLPQLSTQLLVHDKDDSHTQITVSVDEQGTLIYAFS
ncbi:type VI secretion system ATPase TssH, partial [Vibrio parahaemolyticus]